MFVYPQYSQIPVIRFDVIEIKNLYFLKIKETDSCTHVCMFAEQIKLCISLRGMNIALFLFVCCTHFPLLIDLDLELKCPLANLIQQLKP